MKTSDMKTEVLSWSTVWNEHTISRAIDQVVEWFPEEADNIAKHKDVLLHDLVNLVDSDPTSPVYAIEHVPSPHEISPAWAAEDPSLVWASFDAEDLTAIGIDQCVVAVGTVVVDVILFGIGLVGLHVSNQERLTRDLLRELGPDTLRGLARAIHNFSNASGAYAKAKAAFSLLGGIWNAGGFKVLWKVLKDEMKWYQWLKAAATSVVQIIAWFATDGAAFIAEAALSILSAEQLIEDSVAAVKTCH